MWLGAHLLRGWLPGSCHLGLQGLFSPLSPWGGLRSPWGQINLCYYNTEGRQVALPGRARVVHAGCPGPEGWREPGEISREASQPVWADGPREFWGEESKRQFTDMLTTEAFLGGVHLPG